MTRTCFPDGGCAADLYPCFPSTCMKAGLLMVKHNKECDLMSIILLHSHKIKTRNAHHTIDVHKL